MPRKSARLPRNPDLPGMYSHWELKQFGTMAMTTLLQEK